MYFVGRFGQPWRAPQPPVTFTFSAPSGNVILGCDAGSYTLSGQGALFPRDLLITLDAGSYTLSGQTANLVRALKTTADTGSYTLTGQDVTFIQETILSCDAGGYTLSGQAATFSTDPRECPDMAITVTPDGKQSTIIFPEC